VRGGPSCTELYRLVVLLMKRRVYDALKELRKVAGRIVLEMPK